MAFALKGAGGTVNSSAANQSSLVLTTATTAGAVGDLAVIRYAVDNNQTTDGDEGAVTGIVDSSGSNVWVEAAEFTNGQGTAQAGATCGIWYCNLTAPLAVGSTITLSFSNNTSRDVSAAGLEFFTKAAGFDAAVEGTPGTLANDAAAAGSLNVTTSNIACLRIRAIASESSTATALTKTAAFTAVLSQDLTTGGGAATNMGIRGEYLVSTGTGQASAPTGGAGAVDNASVYVAWREVAQTVLVNGWQRAFNNAKAATFLFSVGLLSTQATQFAVPAAEANTVTIEKWQQPLSRAVPVAKAIQGHAFVPFNTPQVAAPTTVEGWQAQLSRPVRAARAVSTQPVVPFFLADVPRGWQQPLSKAPVRAGVADRSEVSFVSPPAAAADNNVTAKAWQQPLSGAPKPASARHSQATTFAVPEQEAASNSVSIDKWQQPLSRAVAVAKAKQGTSFLPLDPAAQVIPVALTYDTSSPGYRTVYYQSRFAPPAFIAPADTSVTIDKWQQPLSKPVSVARARYSQPTFVFATEVPRGWFAPLSVAPPTANARLGVSFVPFDTAQGNTTTVEKWHRPLSGAPAVASAHSVGQPFFGAPTAAEDNNTTLDKWQQPLSKAVPVAQAKQGSAFVPFDTVQTVAGVVTFDKYQQPLSVAPKTARAIHTVVSFVALPFADRPVAWVQPLSKAVPVARARQGNAFVPLNTAQIVATPTTLAWQQPLSRAVPVAKARPTQPLFVSVRFDIPRGWFAPLSVAVKPKRSPQSVLVRVPVEAPAAPSIPVEGMAWFRPLDTLPQTVRAPILAQFAFWPPTQLTVAYPSGPAPDERLVTVAAEDRYVAVVAEYRFVSVEAEDRFVSVESETRDAPA